MAHYIVWNEPALFRLLKDPTGDVGRHMFGRGLRITAAAKMKVGKRTGALAASINMSQEPTRTGQKMTIGSPLSYAYMHQARSYTRCLHAGQAEGSWVQIAGS
jgi:hypothetical protein